MAIWSVTVAKIHKHHNIISNIINNLLELFIGNLARHLELEKVMENERDKINSYWKKESFLFWLIEVTILGDARIKETVEKSAKYWDWKLNAYGKRNQLLIGALRVITKWFPQYLNILILLYLNILIYKKMHPVWNCIYPY